MKALVVDDRSFLLNDEASLNAISQPLAARMRALFEDDWAQGKPLSFEAWRRRPLCEKLVERVARLLRCQL